MTIGICNLTGKKGKFVKSHLIPKAFTRLENSDLPIIQSGFGVPDKKRWDSWYDKKLVTRDGENILEELDDFAIKYLREQKLVWSGWGPMTDLVGQCDHIPGTDWGTRNVEIGKPDKLRLFFLSLLWRAAATSLPEFGAVTLPSCDLEQLRLMLLEGRASPLSFYPNTLVQLSTMGPTHNHTPIKQVKKIPPTEKQEENNIDIFRFYFDGLISHTHIHENDDGYTNSLGELVVGSKNRLLVTTVTSEYSFQLQNLSNILSK